MSKDWGYINPYTKSSTLEAIKMEVDDTSGSVPRLSVGGLERREGQIVKEIGNAMAGEPSYLVHLTDGDGGDRLVGVSDIFAWRQNKGDTWKKIRHPEDTQIRFFDRMSINSDYMDVLPNIARGAGIGSPRAPAD